MRPSSERQQGLKTASTGIRIADHLTPLLVYFVGMLHGESISISFFSFAVTMHTASRLFPQSPRSNIFQRMVRELPSLVHAMPCVG